MNFLTLCQQSAALSGKTIGSSGQPALDKINIQARINIVKADVVSRYAGKWPANYREGWLPLSGLYSTGLADFTLGSFTVHSSAANTLWVSGGFTVANGMKIKGPDNAYYKIASVIDDNNLLLTQPYQGVTLTQQSYQIWQDEYQVYPDALAIGGFIDYNLPQRMTEGWPANMKDSYPFPTSVQEPTVYTVLGRRPSSAQYSAGTIIGSSNVVNVTGQNGTQWIGNVEPGWTITINGTTYTIREVYSNTSLDLYQRMISNYPSGTTYTINKPSSLTVRFRNPTNQRIVHYWYYAKDMPFINDLDEDWIAEEYPRVLINGASYFDYIDKNDVARGFNAQQVYEDSIKNMKVAIEGSYTGIRTLGLYVPPEARG